MGIGSSFIATPALLLLALTGCTVADMRQDVAARETRIDAKQHALAGDEARLAALRVEFAQLRMDLRTKQMTLDELQAGLDRMQRRNALATAQTRQQAAAKQQLADQLKSYRGELDALRQRRDIPIEEKQQRLQHLRDQVRNALELLLDA